MRGNAEYDYKRELHKPDYKILEDYSHLINSSINGMFEEDPSDLKNTLSFVVMLIKQNSHETRKLANHLYSPKGTFQTCYNIWHWLKFNIKYKVDTLGVEEIRTPSRSFYDKQKGIDCEDFTIFACSLLRELRIESSIYVADYDNKNGNYDHIFTTVNEIIIDPVWSNFNEKPKNKELKKIEYLIKI
jgi:hypothetical protein